MLPEANPAVICERVEDGAVLLHRGEEVYFGLNAVAVRVWELLPPVCKSLDELCALLCREYPDVEPSALRSDLIALLEELAANDLVISSGATGESGEALAVPPIKVD